MNRIRTGFFMLLGVFVFLGVFGFSADIAYALPANFQDSVIWSGLDVPTAISFSPDGKIFVAEKSGIIKVFDNLQDATPTVFADLRSKVHDFSDRGLLGLAVDPQFPTRPYIYVFYTMDGPVGSTPPVYNDTCGGFGTCITGSRLSKLAASGNTMISEEIIREDWCQVEDSHSVGTLAFGPDGALYVSHGDGASYSFVDYGQNGGCGDPVNEGGALRSQDIRTSGDSVSYNGSILRINPDTGEAYPGNPLLGGADIQDDRIIAYGLRNPFRFSIDSLTNTLWVGDVGWNNWEEVDYIASSTDAVDNFGWPCYEGNSIQSGYDAANLSICENLYTAGVASSPYYTYAHSGGQAAISGIALYRGNNFPSAYNGALFFADYTRGWIKVMMPGVNGLPNTSTLTDFVPSGAFTVDLKVGPDGSLYYVDIGLGEVHRISYFTQNTPPTAQITADAISGPLPLTVNFDGTASFDSDAGDSLLFSWDLDGDGVFGDASTATTSYVYTAQETISASLRVIDLQGASSTDSIIIEAGNSAPIATILTPTIGTLFRVGDTILFSGEAQDPDTGSLPASALHWNVILHHCAANDPEECHEHGIQSFDGVASGSILAPEHEYPAHLEFRLVADDSTSTTLKGNANVLVQPETVSLTFTSSPSGLQLAVYGAASTTPFTRTAIVNAQTTLSAPTPQTLGTTTYAFSSWSHGGAQTHGITVPETSATFHAVFEATSTPTIWHSWDIVTQPGTPQAILTAASSTATTTIEFYESTNNFGITKSSLFNLFTSGAHPEVFNKVMGYWATIAGADAYPYAGKSTVARGTDTGEANAQSPLGVFDLQLHPASNDHNTVAAFKVPENGTYTISDLGIRRVDAEGNTARLRIFNSQGTQLALLTATNNQDWVTTANTFTLPTLTAGQYIYFGVDRDGDFGWDATEISWTITRLAGNPPTPPVPTCTLTVNPTSINQGESTLLSWTTTDATSLSIDQGIGSITPVASGSLSQSPATTTTYTATAVGAGGNAQCNTTVTVIPVPAPSCTLSVLPTSIIAGNSATLSWTTQNATGLSINQGIGNVTPIVGGSVTISPTATTTYTGLASNAISTSTCAATINVTPTPQLKWNSWDIIPQSTIPQARVASVSGGVLADIEFYESTNNFGVTKASLFSTYTSGSHTESFNAVEKFWSLISGEDAYPYAGKSTVNRGSGAGEGNTPVPLGVRDLQVHPPVSDHNIVVAFKVPQNGTYTISNIGVRRVSNSGATARLRVFNAQRTQLTILTASNNRQWVTTPTTYTLSNLTAGQYIYFGVDRNGNYGWDATEISWTITKN